MHEVRAGGSEIVMARVDGPVMMDAMLKQPWRCRGRDLDDRIALAAEMKTLDPNMDADEIANMHRLARRMRRRG